MIWLTGQACWCCSQQVCYEAVLQVCSNAVLHQFNRHTALPKTAVNHCYRCQAKKTILVITGLMMMRYCENAYNATSTVNPLKQAKKGQNTQAKNVHAKLLGRTMVYRTTTQKAGATFAFRVGETNPAHYGAIHWQHHPVHNIRSSMHNSCCNIQTTPGVHHQHTSHQATAIA